MNNPAKTAGCPAAESVPVNKSMSNAVNAVPDELAWLLAPLAEWSDCVHGRLRNAGVRPPRRQKLQLKSWERRCTCRPVRSARLMANYRPWRNLPLDAASPFPRSQASTQRLDLLSFQRS